MLRSADKRSTSRARKGAIDPSEEEGSERLGGGRDTAAHAHSPLVAVRLHRGHAYLCCGGNVALALCGAEDVAENERGPVAKDVDALYACRASDVIEDRQPPGRPLVDTRRQQLCGHRVCGCVLLLALPTALCGRSLLAVIVPLFAEMGKELISRAKLAAAGAVSVGAHRSHVRWSNVADTTRTSCQDVKKIGIFVGPRAICHVRLAFVS